MKTRIMFVLLTAGLTISASAQSKKDSLKLRADLDAIRQGKQVNTPQQKSVVRVDSTPATVDTVALKSGNPSRITPSPNLPNPQDPRPQVINPNSSTTPVEKAKVPPGSPKGPEFDPNAKQK